MKSPLPQKRNEEIVTTTLSFDKMVLALLSWARATRLAWKDSSIWIYIDNEDGMLKIHLSNNTSENLALHKNDFESTDWVATFPNR